MYIYTILYLNSRRRPESPASVRVSIDEVKELFRKNLLEGVEVEPDREYANSVRETYRELIEKLDFESGNSFEYEVEIFEQFWIITRHEV